MKILHLTPGTGSFYCGSCLRDHALIRALRARGHDAIMAPLYLPLVTDRETSNPEIPIQVGGVSLYLQEKMPWLRFVPRFLLGWLNSPGVLRLASNFIGMTSPHDLGRMTLGALKGESGNQWPEWRRALDWIKDEVKPDVISLSNGLLLGLCPVIERDLGIPVVASLQGEDSFLDTLVEPYREQSWEAMRANAQHVKHFITASDYYGQTMSQRLGVPRDKVTVIYNGMDVTAFTAAKPDPNWPTVGYFARMIHGKGLTLLVDAFIQLAKRGSIPRLRLKLGGSTTPSDAKYLASLRQKLAEAGLTERVEWHPNLSFQDKVKFFRDLTVFSVPATYGEAFGLYVIESMASGVPVVQPRHAAFPELIEATGGGVLCEPDNASALADALEDLLSDGPKRERLISSGVTKVRSEFTAVKMAERFEGVLHAIRKKS